MESIGFKEWSLVCDALGRGEQSIDALDKAEALASLHVLTPEVVRERFGLQRHPLSSQAERSVVEGSRSYLFQAE